MAENKKKEFRAGTYAVIVGIILAVVLTALTIFAYTTRYTAFSPDKVAQTYVDTIVQTGDGYNAYKNTLVSKNQKYGDFIRNAYMRPFVNEEAEQADFVGTGSEEEQEAIDTVYNTMYEYFVGLINQYGFDNYDAVFNNYFAELKDVRHQVYGDDYMDMDYMFGAFEANVAAYGEYLAGADEVLAADKKTVLKDAKVGWYQETYGEDYKLTSTVTDLEELPEAEVKEYVEAYSQRIYPVAQSGETKADTLGVKDLDDKHKFKSSMISAFEKLDCTEEITSVAKATVTVTLEDGTEVASQEVYLVKIGRSWYVDNTNVNTDGLYLAK